MRACRPALSILFAIATSSYAVDPAPTAAVNDALDALHDSGTALKSLAADVALKTTNDLGDDQTKIGRFVMQKSPDGDTRVRATFTEKRSGTKVYAERHDYLLERGTLTERDYAATPKKKQTTRQLRPPGEKADLFKLGEGPFPLPVGQPRDDVLHDFTVDLLPTPDASALAFVKLTPKPATDLAKKFKWITVLIDRATKLPKEVATADPNEVDLNTATLTNVRQNGDVKDAEFKLEPVKADEWDLVDTR